ncbi:MAG: YihY/virulence factor BrkB family protein [Acidimicrobiales bacterium]
MNFQENLRRIDAFQQRHTASSFLFGVVKKFGDDNAGALAAQLTYTFFLTIFPLLLLLVTILGFVLAGDPSARQRVLNSAFGEFPIVGQQLAHNIHELRRNSAFGFVVGIVGLVYGSTGLAQTGLYSMEQIWDIPSAVRPNFVTRMARSLLFLVVLGIGLILTTALAGFGTFGRHNLWLGVVGEILAFVVNLGLYLAAFRTLTPKQVTTRSLLPGVVVGAVAWTILQAVGGYVVGHDLKGASAVYGTFGLVLGLIAWISLGVTITLYAAEMNAVVFHRLWPRGLIQPPLTEADQRSLAMQVTETRRRPEQVVSTWFRTRPMLQDEYRDSAEGGGGSASDVGSPGAGAPPAGVRRTEPAEAGAPEGAGAGAPEGAGAP